ncbi:structural maintenance of chromosomes protein 6-like [Lingula anatina]|uniref:Structural maintenance of chromosomes protein 6 n=1 Tax=Lingula anatina TaxID=7574 RepID=A0A1S3HIS8_LINAN|nr:structural maintenance of chromosomes protein 6-like [Lingula anatina]|eukprot:XP_013384924.1 structural maintenance of chromosomes protein 6-like [Lingula anatina]
MWLSFQEEADMGIIERIQLKNFMCHTRLDFPFCPNINFITGNNGSGKSAILTGLVVGLGGGAKATSRGTSVRGFIKNGKQSGEVIIKLRNRGSEAFKHDQYGDSIIIKRTMKAVGGSAYRLENAEGKLVSNKKEELDHIVDHFNIQINNPVAVLNQDTSRNFLHSKNPNDKYKFFLKATQLEQMKQDYCSITEQMEITKGIISTKETTVPTLHAEVLEWEKKFKAVQNCDDLRGKIQALKNEIAWAIVIECEEVSQPFC